MLFASAVPLVAGKTERYRSLAVALEPHLGEYSALNHQYEVERHSYWINHTRAGSDIGVSVYDISGAGLKAMGSREWDENSAHDRWWLDFVRDVNGIDLLTEPAHGAPPERVFSWKR